MNSNREVAREVFWRYWEGFTRGHASYIEHARLLEDNYLGGGLQWTGAQQQQMQHEGRPAREVNVILPTINAAIGYQLSTRVDISFLPNGGEADTDTARILGKCFKQFLDEAHFRYKETEVFANGLIQQRGYFDMRMDYSRNLLGEIALLSLDPLDVIPDPDAKTYETDGWADVCVTRWLTEHQIEQQYGKGAAAEVVANAVTYLNYTDFGTLESYRLEGFAAVPPSYAQQIGWFQDLANTRRYRIIDRQSREFANCETAVYPSGDMEIVDGLPPEKVQWLIEHGCSIIRRRMPRVRWQVCAPEVTLYNQLSPFSRFTVIPFFPIFRSGRTRGMGDNMLSPQKMLNKFCSQYEHIVNTTANSGWQGEENTVTNYTDEEITEHGASTGLVILRRQGSKAFEKIEPNPVPTGISEMIKLAKEHLNIVSGVDPNGMNIDSTDLSGVAIQSLEYAQQKKIAPMLDNLSRTRHMLAEFGLELVQRYMPQERIVRVAEIDEYGITQWTPLAVNVQQENGIVLNDITVGKYSIAIDERPANITFNNTEFEQLKAMRTQMGIQIPDSVILRASNLADKYEVAQQIEQAAGQPDPKAVVDQALKQAQANFFKAQSVSENIKALFAAEATATQVLANPATAQLADAIAKSAGFVDADAPPIIPTPDQAQPPTAFPRNTHPLDPANPPNPEAGAELGAQAPGEPT